MNQFFEIVDKYGEARDDEPYFEAIQYFFWVTGCDLISFMINSWRNLCSVF